MKFLIATATFNEAQNIVRLIEEIHSILPEHEILVIDDNSPDNTGKILDGLGAKFPLLHTINRPGKLGLGTAHIEMMNYAINNHFDVLITMDADFSHQTKYLKNLVSLIQDQDFVIGSRYVEGGGSNCGWDRKLISVTANILARYLAGIPLKETTTSYRAFKVDLLKRLPLKKLESEGYSFFVESLFHVVRNTNKIKEFPIFFLDRTKGVSKIDRIEIFKSIVTLFRLFFKRISNRQCLKSRIHA